MVGGHLHLRGKFLPNTQSARREFACIQSLWLCSVTLPVVIISIAKKFQVFSNPTELMAPSFGRELHMCCVHKSIAQSALFAMSSGRFLETAIIQHSTLLQKMQTPGFPHLSPLFLVYDPEPELDSGLAVLALLPWLELFVYKVLSMSICCGFLLPTLRNSPKTKTDSF